MNNKPIMLVLSGLPGSGKSRYRREWIAEDPEWRRYINYDELRIEMFGSNWKWNRKDEEAMKGEAYNQASQWLEKGYAACIDNTNLSRNVRAVWSELGRRFGVDVVQHEIDVPVATCVERDRGRLTREGGRVGMGVINNMALRYGFVDWSEVPGDFVIVDIDGTIADCGHRLHHIKPEGHRLGCTQSEPCYCLKKNWPAFFSEVHLDKPIPNIARLVWEYFSHYNVLYVTGRDTSIAVQTEDWLIKHGFMFNGAWLFMRQSGDNRQDTEVKGEILEMLPKDRIRFVLDDRDRVVEMYRAAGLTVLQPAKGSY